MTFYRMPQFLAKRQGKKASQGHGKASERPRGCCGSHYCSREQLQVVSICPYWSCLVYANLYLVALATPYCFHVCVEERSLTDPKTPNPSGLDKIPWQGNEQVYWLEMNEPIKDNMIRKFDRVLAHGYRYCLLIGTSREGKCLLRSD